MKTSVFVGTSLDGFIARPNGAFDFLTAPGGRTPPPGAQESHGYEEFIATVDALAIGRNTYDIVLGFDTWPYGSKPVFVLSTRDLAPAPTGAMVERLSGSPAEVLSTLVARGFQHIYVDGGVTIQRFLAAGCIDRLIISRVPVLIGQGIPLFGALSHDVALDHVATRHFKSGLVQSEYAVLRNA